MTLGECYIDIFVTGCHEFLDAIEEGRFYQIEGVRCETDRLERDDVSCTVFKFVIDDRMRPVATKV